MTTASLAVREFNRKDNEKKKHREFRIHLLKYKTPLQTKGTRKASAVFASELDAHANIFQFRYKFESKESQRLVDEYLLHLESRSREHLATATPAPKKARAENSTVVRRSSAMSQNPRIKRTHGSLVERNPMVPGIFNRYNKGKL